MDWIPIFLRELKVLQRSSPPWRDRVILAAVMSVVSLLLLLISSHFALSLGTAFFGAMFGITLAISSNGLGEVIRILTSDRNSEAAGLLFLCGISGGQILAGKALAAQVRQLLSSIGCMPFFCLSFLLGGVPGKLFPGMLATLFVFSLFFFAAGCWVSSLKVDEGAAPLLGSAAIFLTCGLPFGLYYGAQWAGAAPLNSVLYFSPVYSAYSLVFEGKAGSAFWTNLAIVSIASIAVAGFSLRRMQKQFAHDFESPADRPNTRRGVDRRMGKIWREPVPIDESPFGWMASRSAKYQQWWIAFLAVMICGWILLRCLWGSLAATPLVLWFWATALLIGLKYISTYAVSAPIAEQRRTGNLELLLCTPLPPESILEGQKFAIQRQFNRAWWLVRFVFVIFAIIGVLNRSWNPLALLAYFTTWAGFLALPGPSCQWQAMWFSLNTANPAGAVLQVTGGLGGMGWMWYQMRGIFAAANSYPKGRWGEWGFTAAVVLIVVLCVYLARRRAQFQELLLNHFREVAARPIPAAKDPRLKKWDGKSPL
jgi:hypothetical protein